MPEFIKIFCEIHEMEAEPIKMLTEFIFQLRGEKCETTCLSVLITDMGIKTCKGKQELAVSLCVSF